ncbi:hypothetical protein G3N96_19400 [Burkholderia sp. Se-20373]|uniref:hypothetical protein n=1 Tax=Burkholderia sp. Se-20373 TaxID=2703898 RepID=UPI00197F25BE|nr:hypothetical protein [Burkholderia sp. Se-20373]MBN3747574.1 hypothetical protein [Burkholderia sp. Se-20373]
MIDVVDARPKCLDGRAGPTPDARRRKLNDRGRVPAWPARGRLVCSTVFRFPPLPPAACRRAESRRRDCTGYYFFSFISISICNHLAHFRGMKKAMRAFQKK